MAPVLHLLLALVAGHLGLVLLPSGDAGTRRAFGASDSLAPALLLGLAVHALGASIGRGDEALAALAALAVMRRALGPAALVPRHERLDAVPQAVRLATPFVWTLGLAAALLLDRIELALMVFCAWLVAAGLERLGVARPLRDVGALCAFGVLIGTSGLVDDPGAVTAFALALGALALAAGWVRRADRRDLALATVACAALPSALCGLGALAAVVAATRRPRLALGWAAFGALVGAVRALATNSLVGEYWAACALGLGLGGAFLVLARLRDVRATLARSAAA